MVFSSFVFLFSFFPASVILYYLTPEKFKNISFLLLSFVFFAWSGPIFLIFMVFALAVNYLFGFWISNSKEKNNSRSAKIFLFAVVFIDLSVLFFFKFSGLFLKSANIYPLFGIPFYTLHILSYVFDIYSGDSKKQKNIVSLGVYFAAFSKILAGPVCKYSDFEPQLSHRKINVSLFFCGLRIFICGLCKKILFADTAKSIFVYIKALPDSDVTVVGSWFGLIAFGLFIYFQLSGYFDMAIGLGKIFGFDFPENLNYPYIAKSISEFCRKFCVTIFGWFFGYVYSPFCKNAKSAFLKYINIFTTCILVGFCFGSKFNYIILGAYFGIILIFEKLFVLNFLKKIPAFFCYIYFWVFILFGVLIFAFEDIKKGWVYFGRLFGFFVKGFIDGSSVYDILRYFPFLILAVLGCTPIPKKLFRKFIGKFGSISKISVFFASAALCLFCFAFMVADSGSNSSGINKYFYDRFPFKEEFAEAKVLLSYGFMINENRGVVIAKDGYLIPRFDKYSEKSIAEKSFDELGGSLTFEENMANIKNNSGYINEFFENLHELHPEIKTTFALPPRKVDAMTSKLPFLFPTDRHERYFLELNKHINPDIYCNLLDVMRSCNGDYIYYKTDHHWTSLGAYFAYDALGEYMDYEPFSKDDFKVESASEDFYGVIWAKSGAGWIKADKMEYYCTDENEEDIYSTIIHAEKDVVLNGFYDRAKLETADKYSFFLGGINPHISIGLKVAEIGRKKLLFVSDSFGLNLVQFLARHYDVELIDTRFFNGNIYDFIDEFGITDILVLVNMENFSTQNNLFKLTVN